MNVQLKLDRAHLVTNEFDFDRHIPPHCAVAAYSLFVADALALRRALRLENDEQVRTNAERCLRGNLKKAVMTTLPCSCEKLQGSVPCTLRVAAFAALLGMLPRQSRGAQQRGLEWARRNGLRANTRDTAWDLNDLMFALESLVVHWERVSESAWASETPLGYFQGDAGAYFLFLWKQCARFLSMSRPDDIAEHMNAGKFTLPYSNLPGSSSSSSGSSSVIALHTNTVAQMCEVWRFVRYERFFPFSETPVDLTERAADQEQFLRAFHLEVRQLDVDKFRELLRRRLVARFLCPTDTEVYYHLKPGSRGKGFDPDSVISERHSLNLPGYLQKLASAWTFEKMLQDPIVRDELFRAMADSGCRSKCGSDFTTKFFEEPGPPAQPALRNAGVPYIKRYGHAFVLVHRGEGVSPPSPFASAFKAWLLTLKNNSTVPYGIRFDSLYTHFE